MSLATDDMNLYIPPPAGIRITVVPEVALVVNVHVPTVALLESLIVIISSLAPFIVNVTATVVAKFIHLLVLPSYTRKSPSCGVVILVSSNPAKEELPPPHCRL